MFSVLFDNLTFSIYSSEILYIFDIIGKHLWIIRWLNSSGLLMFSGGIEWNIGLRWVKIWESTPVNALWVKIFNLLLAFTKGHLLNCNQKDHRFKLAIKFSLPNVLPFLSWVILTKGPFFSFIFWENNWKRTFSYLYNSLLFQPYFIWCFFVFLKF